MATIPLPSDFRDFLQLLNSEGVEYLLVGGYAVAFYGHVRTTADMDVWIGATTPNALRAIEALAKFGFSRDSLKDLTLDKPRQVVRMGVPPMQIDLITSVTGCDFAECFARRTTKTHDGVPISLIDLGDLLANKQASGRLKDLADVAALKEEE
jgi:predicted nucleotidyltransferase